MSEIRVKVADHAVAKGKVVIATIGLGSCIAIMLYDLESAVGGLAHVLLPSMSLSRDTDNRAKFPETAVPLLLDEMRALGARGAIQAKIAGGSSMFSSLIPVNGVNIGERNIVATHQALAAHGIPLIGQDTGGDHGRSVYLHVDEGRVVVRSIKRGISVI